VRSVEAEPTATPISNAQIAMVMLLVAETMFFAGLIGAYLLFRVSSMEWPPADLPSLPLRVAWVNTIILMLSGVAMRDSLRALRRDRQITFRRGLLMTLALGSAFVIVQVAEAVRLIHHGLTLSSGAYGGTFYTLIGAHALHVVAAVVWLGAVCILARRGRFTASRRLGVELCGIYWFFVCALWLVLFGLVYK
jgi:heme/copper-type cytochrome/quinol oxidase subunit 3